MNAEETTAAAEQPAKIEPQTVATKPVKVKKPTTKTKKPATKTATKAKAPAKSKGKVKKTAKPSKSAKAKPAKLVKAGKYPRHPKNPFREGNCAYGQIFDAFVRREAGVRRDDLTKLAMEATGKDVKHASYDLAVILSAKESNNGPRHPSCREGFWVKREGDHLTLMID